VSLTILAVDDEPAILDSVELALQSQGYTVVTAPSGRSAVESYDKVKPDLVVLDRLLPEGDGIWVLGELRKRGDVPVLMLTALDELEDRVSGLDHGADDYLAKPFRVKELQARVRALLRRARSASNEEELARGVLRVNLSRREAFWGERRLDLTAREFDLLVVLARQPGRVFSKAQLLDQVWGWEESASENAVEVYVSSLRGKLGSRTAVRTVRGIGYALEDPPGSAADG
jgi:DNA-binding response OmpR family regulator